MKALGLGRFRSILVFPGGCPQGPIYKVGLISTSVIPLPVSSVCFRFMILDCNLIEVGSVSYYESITGPSTM